MRFLDADCSRHGSSAKSSAVGLGPTGTASKGTPRYFILSLRLGWGGGGSGG